MFHVKTWVFFLCRSHYLSVSVQFPFNGFCQSHTFWYLGTHFYCAAVNGSIIAASEAVLAHYLMLSQVCVLEYELFHETETDPLNCLELCYRTSLFTHNLSSHYHLVRLSHFFDLCQHYALNILLLMQELGG